MGMRELIEDRLISSERLARHLRTTKREIGETLGIAPESLSRRQRVAKPRWLYLPTSGQGVVRRGGRFNRIGEPALYTSHTHETAARELRFSLNQKPYTCYFPEVDCQDIADLTPRDVRQGLGITWDDLANDSWESEMHRGPEPSTHAIAAGLKRDGYAGILVDGYAPGATPDDINLVCGPGRRLTGSPPGARMQ